MHTVSINSILNYTCNNKTVYIHLVTVYSTLKFLNRSPYEAQASIVIMRENERGCKHSKSRFSNYLVNNNTNTEDLVKIKRTHDLFFKILHFNLDQFSSFHRKKKTCSSTIS